MVQEQKQKSSWRDVVDRHWLLSNIILSIISIFVAIVACEIGFRLLVAQANPQVAARVKDFQKIAQIDDTGMRFQPHPYLSYSRADTILNKDGIEIDGQFYSFYKAPDVIRVACLGGSTTMRQYPFLLQKYLDALPYDDITFEVMDFGCDGYTTQESLINYLIRVMEFDPDYVIVHHGVNDSPPRLWPRFQRDYAHFRTAWNGRKVSDFEKRLIRYSALFTFLLHREGVSAFELQNNVIKRIPAEAMQTTPTPGSLEIYKNNLIKLHYLITQHGAKMILCPMAYNINDGSELNRQMIVDANQVMVDLSNQYNIALADATPLMLDHPDWFYDIVHVKDKGQYYKTQIYTQTLHQLINQSQPGKKVDQVLQFAPTTLGRDIMIAWDFEPEGTQDYHIQVRINREEDMLYFGRTKSADVKSFRWTYDKPENSPVLVEKFQEGPTYGNHYTFRVLAIDPDREKIVLESQTQEVKYWDIGEITNE